MDPSLNADQRNRAIYSIYQAAEKAYLVAQEEKLPTNKVAKLKRRLEEAETALFVVNEALVGQYVKKFHIQGTTASSEDYWAAGRFALLEAIRTWDPTKDSKLAGWAWYRFQLYVKAEVEKNIFMVSHLDFETTPIVNRAIAALSRSTGGEPTDEEIKAYTGLGIKQIRRIRDNAKTNRLTSLDTPVGKSSDKESLSLKDTIAVTTLDNGGYENSDLASRQLLSKKLPNILDLWTMLRYKGLDGGPAEVLVSLSAAREESRETIRRRIKATEEKIFS